MGRRLSSAARGLFAAAALFGCARIGAAPSPPDTIRILTWNIHAGRGMDGVLDLDRMAEVIRSVDPDLVALQEVDRNTERSGGRDLPAELARRTGLEPVFGPNLSFQGGEFGNAVLARIPVGQPRNHALPTLDHGEQRGALVVPVEGRVGPFLFIATHLDHRAPDTERLASLAFIDSIADPARPAVLAGDLNDVPASATLRRLRGSWTLVDTTGATFPADSPLRRIDYIAYRPAGIWEVVETRVLDVPVASDHRPVLAVLRRVQRDTR